MNRVEITRAQYNALTIKNANTAYLITDENGTVYKGSNLINKNWNSYVPSVASIAVTTPPTKTSYYEGETLDLTGIAVTGTYDSGTTAEVTSSCSYNPANGSTLSLGQSAVNVTYGTSITTTQAITVNAKELVSIAVTTPPSKVTYIEGEALDLTGMVVTATYSDSSTAPITAYTTSPANGTTLTLGTTTVTISYGGKTATQSITAVKALLCFTALNAKTVIGMSVVGSPTTRDVKYSTDGTTWQAFTPGTTTVTLTKIGNKVYFKGNNPTGFSTDYNAYYQFTAHDTDGFNLDVAVEGSVMSLIDDGLGTTTTIPCNWCFTSLFRDCPITSAPILPATTLTDGCYYQMFYNAWIVTAPALPALSVPLSAYNTMFCGCGQLTTPPALPATTLGTRAYNNMFLSCSSLTSVPALPATTLADWCYENMFNYCSVLYISDQPVSGTAEQAWTLPTTGTFTATYSQSNMFNGCAGTRASNNMAGEAGQSYTYYTQNAPV